MIELPRSLPEFEARFPDDAACARWLLEKRWPDGFRCPACGHDQAWELGRERLTLQCAACERQVSVTAGTVLHGSHLGLRTWFLAAWLMATHKNGISARQLWLQLGLGSYKSAWLLARKLRRAVDEHVSGRLLEAAVEPSLMLLDATRAPGAVGAIDEAGDPLKIAAAAFAAAVCPPEAGEDPPPGHPAGMADRQHPYPALNAARASCQHDDAVGILVAGRSRQIDREPGEAQGPEQDERAEEAADHGARRKVAMRAACAARTARPASASGDSTRISQAVAPKL